MFSAVISLALTTSRSQQEISQVLCHTANASLTTKMAQLFGHLMATLEEEHGRCCSHHNAQQNDDDNHHQPCAMQIGCGLAMRCRIGIVGLRVGHAIGVVGKVVATVMAYVMRATWMRTRGVHMIRGIHIQRYLCKRNPVR